MKLKPTFLLFTLLLITVIKSYGQQPAPKPGSISGIVTDTKKNPLSYATVTLLRQDSSVVNGDLTKEDGSFKINATGTGNFILRINAIGYVPRYIPDIIVTPKDAEKQLKKIMVSPTSQSLSEVEFVAERPVVEMSVDKKVFNVEKNITSAGGSAVDALKNVPSLSVDIDGDVALRGKAATILIDGKPATLLGDDVASALQSLPASSIQSVEVITNPSAKYDAQGMSGIINIITKKDNRFGLNGSLSAGAGTHDKYNAGLNLNLRNDKWNFFLNSNFRRNLNYHRGYNERSTSEGMLTAGSYEDNTRTHGGWFSSLGAEYTINEKNTLSLTQNLNLMLWGNKGTTTYFNYINGIQDSSQVRSSDNLGAPLSSSTSLDYKHKFKKQKQELTTNLTFADTWVKRDQEFQTNYYDADHSSYRSAVLQKAPGGGSSASLNGQADFTTPFVFTNGKLDAGWKSQLYWFESGNNATIDSGNGPQKDPTLQNNYEYAQQVHAAYASFGDQQGKLGYQAGLRLEYSHYEGTASALGGQRYGNEFLNLFPSAYLSYKLAPKQDIYLSYTRRIDRPNFFQMMPYVDVSNPQDTNSGNPGLIPEFIHNTEFSYSRQFEKGHNVIASVYYQYTQNLIDRVKTFHENGNSYTRPQNLGSGTTYGVEVTARTQLMPVWDATVNFNFFQNSINGSNVISNNSGNSWFVKLNSNLKLPYSLSLQLSGNYDAPKINAQGKTQEVYWIDLGLRKNLLKNKATIVLNVSDIFNTRKYTNVYDLYGSSQTIYKDRETRIGNITFTYRFGRSDSKTPNRRNKDQNQVKDRDNLKQEDGDQGGF